ncbi:MAG: hypothetical protein NTZ54_07955, partial [Alphaproteobacteria bacterium]|nr:hypothetical protein [Alphaproteobacteria bacterium]
MRFWRIVALLGVLAAPVLAEDEADSKDPKLPVEGRNGSFARVIPIDVPDFRGIGPRLRLVYDSSSGVRNLPPTGGELGVGWSLQGVSAIQRVSGTPAPATGQNKAPSGRGAPAYGAAGFPTDSFLLDGTELIPCSEVANPGTTPSCASGVDSSAYTSRFETYDRIRRNSSANSWDVTGRDGVRSVYTSLDGTSSDLTSRWHLSSVIDRRGNHVDYGWSCNTGHCTIASIRAYSQGSGSPASEILFYTEARPDRITYGDGRGMRAMTRRITTIQINSGGAQQAAYRLDYEVSASTFLSRLVTVQKYGSDAAISNGLISPGSGTALPPYRMTYTDNGDAEGHPIFDKRTDWTGPGVSAIKPIDETCAFGLPCVYPKSTEIVGDFNGDGWATDYYLPKTCLGATVPDAKDPKDGKAGTLPGHVCIDERVHYANGGPAVLKYSLTKESRPDAGKTPQSDNITGQGDFNGDGATDFAQAWYRDTSSCHTKSCQASYEFQGLGDKMLTAGGGEGLGKVSGWP